HRISLTIQKLDQILDGELNEFIDALIAEEQAEQLKSIGG
ncbi:MAG TPA: peptide chain release factor 1, partial [Bacillota bacterium]|nr:peptide chain release factor 1 [Bacillota bacterium]